MMTVGASLLAKNPRALLACWMPALSFTFFASKLAPTGTYDWMPHMENQGSETPQKGHRPSM
ncbi:hypothetical protein PE143B_0112455 [Pseudomonas extremaustralis 14-3 substr. 14-3b]|nr:hypothetical protein PE143B_0112455 [Pseudomonas extremaustralis 14-3 substr. 14-3b]